MKIFPIHRLVTKLCVALSLLCCCALLEAQSSPCGNATGNICPSNCGNFQGFQFDSQGPDYGVTADIACGSNCGMIQANIYNSPDCNFNGLGPSAIQSALASANGEQVLMPACGGGFRPLVEKPLAVAQRDWELPKALPVLR
jgi:hypothetical protein